MGRNIGMVKVLMQQKAKDARRDLEVIDHQYHRARRCLWKTIPYNSTEAQEAHLLLKQEMDLAYRTGKDKVRNKINHLSQKYSRQVPDTIKGIRITDKALGEKRQLPQPVIMDVEVSTNAKETLQLPPKTATYRPISIRECETEIEKMIVKLKWEKRSEAERKETGASKEEWQEAKRQETEVHNVENATLNFNNMGVTQLPTNPEAKMPGEYHNPKQNAIN